MWDSRFALGTENHCLVTTTNRAYVPLLPAMRLPMTKWCQVKGYKGPQLLFQMLEIALTDGVGTMCDIINEYQDLTYAAAGPLTPNQRSQILVTSLQTKY
uniref:Uncharacterized protein n=1 Tax=Physcomitrium patens TaxID=3218 RepID=A0A2K1LB14_PHYPA|nr:hypothetical protein PHYPA_001628 [Physcomitrium patens]